MKTTLELPDDLFQRIKLRAVRRKRKLKDEIAQLLETGLANAADDDRPSRPPKPTKLRGHGPVSLRDIQSAIESGRE